MVVFSLLIGVEQRRRYINAEAETLFGTDRTFTLIGILGYVLYVLSPQTLLAFMGGGLALLVLLSIYYFQRIQQQHKFGLTTLIIALLTYCLGPLTFTQPSWLVLLLVVCLLIISEIKDVLFQFSRKVENDEFITLAKFLVLAGVILPLLPDTPVSPAINVSPYRVWLAVVVVSSISYASYLLKKFVFPNAGVILTGILGGLYSSTATTVILARKSRETPQDKRVLPAIIFATTMMYLRIWLLAFFFNRTVAFCLLPYFIVFILVSVVIGIWFLRAGAAQGNGNTTLGLKEHTNPLEFKTALVFAGLFIFFAVATNYVLNLYGGQGVNIMSFIVGFTDIDPFIINLFQSKWNVADAVIVTATLNAITSNNVLKLAYALALGDKGKRRNLVIAFSILVLLGVLFAYFIPLDTLFFVQ
ncbi:MAG TPA: DUF4010 domain-containing protein [Chitinophagales bacterium]|nr:DUF4010 domain-containing protein [Chitinophagales bacterium]